MDLEVFKVFFTPLLEKVADAAWEHSVEKVERQKGAVQPQPRKPKEARTSRASRRWGLLVPCLQSEHVEQ